MHIGPLSFLNRTSERGCIGLASWHSRHSLTWHWLLHARLRPNPLSKVFAHRNSAGWGVGIGLAKLHGIHHNSGGQGGLSILWLNLHWAWQRPMWFRDMYRRAFDESEALRHENDRLQRQLSDLQFLASRAVDPSVGANLN